MKKLLFARLAYSLFWWWLVLTIINIARESRKQAILDNYGEFADTDDFIDKGIAKLKEGLEICRFQLDKMKAVKQLEKFVNFKGGK